MMSRVKGRWVASVLVALMALAGLEWAALAYPQSPSGELRVVFDVAGTDVLASRVTAPRAYLLRGPHLASRQVKRLQAGNPTPLPPLGPQSMTSAEREHLVAGSVLTTLSIVLLVNFLWMVVIGAIWFFGYYLGSDLEDPAFPPQGALFFVSFGFLVPGVILLPLGLKELKVYRAMESAEWSAPSGPPICYQAGGVPLLRF